MLVLSDFSQEFLLDTDASDQGIGAVLSQTQNDGQEIFFGIYYVWFLNCFRKYLLGREFTLCTDYGSQVWLVM